MPLNAFTNEVDSHARRENHPDTYRDLLAGTEETYYNAHMMDFSFKHAPVVSNHVDPTTWWRDVYSVVELGVREYGTKIVRNDGSYERYTRNTLTPETGDLRTVWTDISDIIDNARAMANVGALNNLKGNKQQVFVDLAESRQTFRMLEQSALSLAGALGAIKRGNVGSALRQLGLSRSGITSGKSLADGYLQYRYGWKPLVDSVYGYQEALKKDWALNLVLKSKGFAPINFSRNHTYSDGSSYTERAEGGTRTVYTARVAREALAKADSLGAINPLEFAWEIIPYSFVVDWFIPVGNVLSAFSAIAGLEDVKGYTSTWLDRSRTDTGATSHPDWQYLTSPGYVKYAGYNFSRKTHGVISPSLYGDPSPFGGVKRSRGLAAAALIHQLLR